MTETIEKSKLEDLLISDFRNNLKIISANDTPTVRQYRLDAINQFEKTGIPSSNDELWRFFNIRKHLDSKGRIAHPFLPPENVNSPVREIFSCDITELDSYDLALINGWFPRSLPLLQRLKKCVLMGSFSEAMQLYPEVIDQYMNKSIDQNKDPFMMLNTAFATDGFFANIPDNAFPEKPIQIVNLVVEKEGELWLPFINFRNLVTIGKNAKATLIICDHTLSNNYNFTNNVMEIFVGENSSLEIIRVQNQNNFGSQITTMNIVQEANSRVVSNMLSLNGGFIRNNINVTLKGKNAETNLFGVYLMDREQYVENNTYIDHQVPECSSNELYKGILDEKAKGVFRGRIHVRKDAQKTASYQKNNNLLLTDEAVADSMPQLEIYADDVKCSHGATVGYLGADELFYLRSRGISEKEARIMLMNSFCAEIIDKISIPDLHDRISFLVSKRLRGELSHCNSCVYRCRE